MLVIFVSLYVLYKLAHPFLEEEREKVIVIEIHPFLESYATPRLSYSEGPKLRLDTDVTQ